MKKISYRVVSVVFLLLMCMGLAGCGSSAGKHLKSYYNNASAIVGNLASSGKSASSSGTKEDIQVSSAQQLSTPADFAVDAEGNYSFAGVENADFYLIYLCDESATKDEDDYLYSSDPIQETGAGSYSGKLSDSLQAAYGKYLVKVFAFPELTDTTYSMSSAALAEYTYSGTQNNPKIDYFWNTVDGTMELVLTNVGDYTYQAYPDEVSVTFADAENPEDTVLVSMTDISEDNNTATTNQLAKGIAYNVSAVSKSGSEYVLNQESDVVTVAEGLILGEVNILSEQYTWSDGWASFPRLTPAFDLANGGSAGTMTGRQGAMSAELEAVPVSANAGCDYSYTVTVDFGGFTMDGTLDLKTDGTVEWNENGGGPISAGSIYGCWSNNGDGTAAISFAPADISS